MSSLIFFLLLGSLCSGLQNPAELKYHDSVGNEFFRIRDIRGFDVHVFGAFWDMRQREYSTKNANGCYRARGSEADSLKIQIQETLVDDRRRLWWLFGGKSSKQSTKERQWEMSEQGQTGQQENTFSFYKPTGNETKKSLYVGVYLSGHKDILKHKLNQSIAFAIQNGAVDYRSGVCELHYSSGTVVRVPYRIQKQRREIDKPRQTLIGAYAICDLCAVDQSRDWPIAVSLVPKNYVGVNQIMSIRGNRAALIKLTDDVVSPEQDLRGDLAVCVRPVFGKYTNYPQMASFLLYYTMTGVSHFVMYNGGSITPKMLELFNIARKAGVSVELRAWNFDDQAAYERLQNMNIEICVHSLLGHFKFVAVVDLDEYIVPRRETSLIQLLHDQTHAVATDQPIQAFILTTAFFCPLKAKSRVGTTGSTRQEVQLSLFCDVKRSIYITHGRFKYIVRPEALHAALIHRPYILRHLMHGNALFFVPTEQASVNHYRGTDGLFVDQKEASDCSILDTKLVDNMFSSGILQSELYMRLLQEGFLDDR